MAVVNPNGAAARAPVLLLMVSSVVWGCTWIPLKAFAGTALEGAALMGLAYGTVALAGWVFGRRWWTGAAADWRALVGIGLLGGYASIAFNLSVMYGDVVRMMSLFYTLPVWAVLGGLLFLGERITAMRALAVLLALLGAWLILGGMQVLASPPGWLDLLALSAGFAFSMNNIVFRATATRPMPPKILVMFTGSALYSLAVLLAGLQPWPAAVSGQQLAAAVAFGFGWLLLANIATQWSVTRLEAGRAAIIIILELVAAVVTSMWLLGSRLSPVEWCGAALILAAAWLEARG